MTVVLYDELREELRQFERSIITKKDIMDIRDEAARAAHEACSEMYLPEFDEKRLYEFDYGIMSKLRKALEDKEEIYRDNAELYVICEMALLYLDSKENERKDNVKVDTSRGDGLWQPGDDI